MSAYEFTVPEKKQVRVIVHTDCKNEADDQFALAHHLMTPRFQVKGIVAGHFDGHPMYDKDATAQASYDEVEKVLDLMGLSGQYPVALGAPHAMADAQTPIDSPGAQMIIAEARRDDPRPLYVAAQGAITDIASALLLAPDIADRMTVIWVGGGDYPAGEFEFNLYMDVNAANAVFDSTVELWQITKSVYKQFAVSLAELQLKVKPCGAIGAYLFENMVELNERLSAAWDGDWPQGEVWGLGDQAPIAVLLEETEKADYDMIPAPRIREDQTYAFDTVERRPIRVYNTVDTRLTLEDFFAKLALNYRA